MGLIRKILTWGLFILSAFILAYFTAVMFDFPMWVGILLFFVYLGIILTVTHYIRKKIYQHRTGFIESASAIKSEQTDLYTTYLQTLHSISHGNNKAAKKRFYNEPWLLYFEFDNHHLSETISQYEVLPTEPKAARGIGAARWFWLSNLVLIKPNQSIVDSHGYDPHWVKFLEAVKHCRAITPFNKIVISLSVKTLMNNDKNSLQKYLDIFKTRMMQLTDITGYKIPVVVLLSDLDMLSGYQGFVELLSENDKQQAFGLYNRGDETGFGATDFGTNVIADLADIIDNFIDRISYERKNSKPIIAYEFVRQFRELQKGWQSINQILFDQNLPNPLLSGLFLLGVDRNQEKNQDANNARPQAIFMRDLFEIILRKQSLLPILTEVEKQKQERHYKFKLSVIYALVILFLLYVVISFVSTSRNLVLLLKAIPQHIQYTNNFEQNLSTMTEYNNLMNEIVAFRQHWTVSIFPFDAGLDRLEKLYAKQFVEQFRQHVVVILDNNISAFLRSHSKSLTSLQRGYLVQNLVSRINIIQAKLNNQSYSYIVQLSSPELKNLGFSSLINFENFGKLYKTYTAWEPNANLLHKEKGQLVEWLTQFKLLSQEKLNMKWLVDWANTQQTLTALPLSYFWHGEKNLDATVQVDPAYTHAGKEAINSLIAEINTAVPAHLSLNYEEKGFQEWYEAQRLNAWYTFALNFNKGVQSLNYKTQWDHFYNPFVILSLQGPYYQLLDIMHNEFADSTLKNPPIWLLQLKQFYALLDYHVKKNKLDSARNITVVTRDFLHDIASKPSTLKSRSAIGSTYRENFDNELKAAQAFIDYQANLNSLYSQAAASEGQLFGISKAIYDTNAGKVEPQAQNVLKAFDHYNTMRQLISKNRDGDSIFWLILRGPFDYYVDYVNRYGSCYVQQQWVADVLTPTNGLVGDELTHTLFGQNGLAWSFLNKYVNSFLEINANLFVPQVMFGHIFPFSDAFYDFINSGITIQSMNREQSAFENYFNKSGGRLLTVNSSATNVNAGAKLLPYQTVLTSVCNKQTVEIKNFNFPTSQNINWSLGECGPAQIAIYFNGLTVTKDYPGKFGFAQFLHDFAKGSQTFQASEFPESQKVLQAYDIRNIIVNYQISGLSDVLYKLDQFFAIYDQLIKNEKRYLMSGAVPANVTLCWQNSVMQKMYNQEEKDIKIMLPQSSTLSLPLNAPSFTKPQ